MEQKRLATHSKGPLGLEEGSGRNDRIHIWCSLSDRPLQDCKGNKMTAQELGLNGHTVKVS